MSAKHLGHAFGYMSRGTQQHKLSSRLPPSPHHRCLQLDKGNFNRKVEP